MLNNNMKKNMKKKKSPLPLEDNQPMTDKQMDRLLVDLYYLKNWEALKRFISIEMIKAENALCTLNLSESLVEASRNQGIRMGLHSLVQYIENEIVRRERSKNGDEEAEDEAEDDVPNYNYK